MDAFSRQLDFTALLAALQGWLGSDLCVMVHRRGAEFNIGFCARLERIRSPREGGEPAVLDFEGARELTLAPVEGVASLHSVRGGRGAAEWIEVNLAFDMVATIERVP
jgi:hypothetical protein